MSSAPVRSIHDGPAEPPAAEASLLGLLNVLLRRRWLVILPAVVAFALAAGVTLTRPRTYTATAAFVPQARQSGGALQGISSQLGIGLAPTDPMQSPQFYVELVQSRAILQDLADTRYTFATDTGRITGTLAEIFRPSGPAPAQRRAQLIRDLGDQVEGEQTQQTGTVRVSVTTPYRELSPRMVDRILELVTGFNLQTRQSQARAERRFIEQRLGQVRAELRTAEDRLQSFLQRNREFGMSPALTVERDRLERAVATHRTLYTELAQNFERARMEEVRDTPVITVLEEPEVPALADPRGLLRNGVLALIAGGVFGVVLAFSSEYMRRLRDRDTGDYAQFLHLRRESLRDLTHPWRPVARLVRRRGD